MRFPLILGHLMSRPWAMRPDSMQAIATILHRAETGGRVDLSPLTPSGETGIVDKRATRWYHRSTKGQTSNFQRNWGEKAPEPSVAVIPMQGVISKYVDRGACESGFDLRDFDRELAEAANDANVTEIVMHVHSPGGSCTGVAETARRIAHVADNIKPVYMYTDSDACSAAYWDGVACTNVFASEMACIGSIGVYLAWIDQAKWLEAQGFELKLFKAGTFKAATMPGQLTDEAGQLLQNEVDSIAQSFYAWVRDRRSKAGATVEDGTMQGQTFLGREAMNVGLVDGLYNGINDLLTDLINS